MIGANQKLVDGESQVSWIFGPILGFSDQSWDFVFTFFFTTSTIVSKADLSQTRPPDHRHTEIQVNLAIKNLQVNWKDDHLDLLALFKEYPKISLIHINPHYILTVYPQLSFLHLLQVVLRWWDGWHHHVSLTWHVPVIRLPLIHWSNHEHSLGHHWSQFLSGRGWKMMEQHLQRPQSLSNSWLFFEISMLLGRFQWLPPQKNKKHNRRGGLYAATHLAAIDWNSCHVAFSLVTNCTISRPAVATVHFRRMGLGLKSGAWGGFVGWFIFLVEDSIL